MTLLIHALWWQVQLSEKVYSCKYSGNCFIQAKLWNTDGKHGQKMVQSKCTCRIKHSCYEYNTVLIYVHKSMMNPECNQNVFTFVLEYQNWV